MPRSNKSNWQWTYPHMQSPHSESLESPVIIPDSKLTLLANKDNWGQQSQLLTAILITNLSNWASWCREEWGTGEEKKTPWRTSKMKTNIFWRCTLLIAPMNLMKHFQPEALSTIQIKMHLQTLQRTPHDKGENEGEKEFLWQLLLQRSGVPAPLLSWLL